MGRLGGGRAGLPATLRPVGFAAGWPPRIRHPARSAPKRVCGACAPRPECVKPQSSAWFAYTSREARFGRHKNESQLVTVNKGGVNKREVGTWSPTSTCPLAW